VSSCENLRLCIVQFVERWLGGGVAFKKVEHRGNLCCEDDELTNNLVTILGDMILYRLLPTKSLLRTDVSINITWDTAE